jgi:hypothetical protein
MSEVLDMNIASFYSLIACTGRKRQLELFLLGLFYDPVKPPGVQKPHPHRNNWGKSEWRAVLPCNKKGVR